MYDVTVYLRKIGICHYALFNKRNDQLVDWMRVGHDDEARRLAWIYCSSFSSWEIKDEL